MKAQSKPARPPALPAGGESVLRARWGVLLLGAAVFVVTIGAYATDSSLVVFALVLVEGSIAAAWVAAAALLGGGLLRLAGVRTHPVLQFATASALGLGAFSLAALGLGLMGWLSRTSALLMPAAGVVVWVATLVEDRRRILAMLDGQRWRDALSRPAGWEWTWVVPVVFLAIGAMGATVLPGMMWRPDDPHPYDVISYHFQIPREWYELGRIVPLEHNVFSFFPFNIEMQYLLAMHLRGGPWEGMYLAQFINLAFVALTVLAVYGTIRAAGGAKPSATIAAAAAAAVPWLVMLGCVGFNEPGLLLWGTLAVVWVVVSIPMPQGGLRGMMVAGALAGLACGAKYPAVPMVLLSVPAVAWVMMMLRGAGFQPALDGFKARATAGCALFMIIGAIVFAPWVVRNVAWAGNPVFPLAMHTFGQGHFDDAQVERWNRAHGPRPDQRPLTVRVAALWREVPGHWQYGYLFLPVALAAAGVAWRRWQVRFILALLLVHVVIWIGFTHLIGRFLVLAIPLGALLVGQVKWEQWRGLAMVGVVWVAALAGVAWWGLHPRLQYFAEMGRAGLFGVRELEFMIPEELAGVRHDPQIHIALIGDAGAFLYQMPMQRLRYRTVFDVDPGAPHPIEAWLDEPAEQLPPNLRLVINPMEIQRLSATYWRIPPLPPDFPGPRDRPFVLREVPRGGMD